MKKEVFDLISKNEYIIGADVAHQFYIYLEFLEMQMDSKLDYYFIENSSNRENSLSAENAFDYGDRIVVFVDYNSGNDNNDGSTKEKAFKTLEKAVLLLSEVNSLEVVIASGTYDITSDGYISVNSDISLRNKISKATSMRLSQV